MSDTKEPTKTRGNWNATNIISIVVGIILFWPVGLFLLIWVLMDRDVVEIGHFLKREWRSFTSKFSSGRSATGNRVFDEYQQTQMDKIKEIKKEVNERKAAFYAYKEQRARDIEEAEFDEFMKKPADSGQAPK